MRVLIALAEPLPPQQTGGSQKVAFEIAAGLRSLGDEVHLAGRLEPRKFTGVSYLIGAVAQRRLWYTHNFKGIKTTRFLKERRTFRDILDQVNPDVVLMHGMAAMPIAHTTSTAGLPLVVYWHDAEDQRLGGMPKGLVADYIANSWFTAAHYRKLFGIDSEVISPVFGESIRGRVEISTASRSFLFVNPVREKGLALVLEVARLCPTIPFEFLESWTIGQDQKRELISSLKPLSNVRLTRRQEDILPVFSRSRAVIMPSLWLEAWGRVASEAQAVGLPVVARSVGGLPESVGPGGVLMQPDAPAQEWAEVIQKLSSDSVLYNQLVAKALDYAKRPDVCAQANLSKLRRRLESTVQSHRSAT